MRFFGELRQARAFARQHMKFLKTMEDVDLLLEIGYHQERGEPLTIKALYRAGIASMPTVQRRLQRLRQAGVIVERRSESDGRSMEVTLAQHIFRLYEKYAEHLRAA